jgi:hypothetical protein
VVVRAKPGIIKPSHRRGNHGVHRTDTLPARICAGGRGKPGPYRDRYCDKDLPFDGVSGPKLSFIAKVTKIDNISPKTYNETGKAFFSIATRPRRFHRI